MSRVALCTLLAAALNACGGGDSSGTASALSTAGTPTAVAAATNAASASDTTTTVVAWVRVALEGDAFIPAGTQTIRFGDGINWVTQTLSSAATCSTGQFGSDPSVGTQKFCEAQVTVPAVTQIAGARPVINNALIPGPGNPYTADRVRALTATELSASNFQTVPSDIGAFREPCTYSHMAFDDPIAYPNQPGVSHLHTFAGNSSTSASSTTESLASASGSTCAGGTLNRTAYWQPAMIDTRTGQPLVPTGLNFYYKQGYLGVAPGTMQAFPKGLRILSGNAENTDPAGNFLARFSCLNGGSWQATIPSCAVGDSVMVGVTFPQCWDGINLDSPDHKSHMAYATGTGCPTDHPVPLPEITLNFLYEVTEANNGDYWRLSSDNYAGPGGLSLHADWYGGWDPSINQTFVTYCDNATMDCHDNLLGDGRILY